MADKIYKRFRNIRTDYQKLREREAKGKSGSGSSKPFTPLQQWKLTRYAFLQPFYRDKRLTSSQVLGSVSICKAFSVFLPFGYVYFAVFDMTIYIFGPVFVYNSDSTAGDFRRPGFRLGELGQEARHWIRVSFPHEAIHEVQEGKG